MVSSVAILPVIANVVCFANLYCVESGYRDLRYASCPALSVPVPRIVPSFAIFAVHVA